MREKVILVPTDFSKNAGNAVRFAVGLACDLNARMIVLHAYRLVQTLTNVNQSAFSIKNEWDKNTRTQFDLLKKDILSDCKLEIHFESEVGFAADAIVSSVESIDVDLVIMGSSGEGAWRSVFGSTTIKTINKVSCPVIVVPPGATYNGLDQITFAYDFRRVNEFSKFNLLKEFMQRFNSHLEILNINDRKTKKTPGESNGELKFFDQNFEELDYSYSFIKNPSISEGILHYITERPIDLLVLLKRDHTLYENIFMKSVTREVVLNSELPLMVLRE